MKVKGTPYLTYCDLINKFNLLNFEKIPKVNKIVLEFPLKSFLPFYHEYYNSTVTDDNIQLKGTFFWYILLNSFPTIQFQDVKVTKFNRNKVEGDFLLRITLTDKDQINDLLSRIFSETASYSKRIKNQNLGRFFISKNSSASYNFFIPGSFFSDANELFSVKIKNTDLKQVKVFTSIIFYNIPQNINMQNLIAYLSFIH